jgi:LmbE family N-acetylglucosaminyl deacetylase
MLKLKLFESNKMPKILCLGAHPDDIEIGCGGTLLRFVEEAPEAQFRWIVFSGNKIRNKEASQSASSFLKKIKSKQIVIHSFRESYFPFIGAEIKDCFEKIRKEYNPDIILTHHNNDAHQDHMLISKLTWNTFRNHFIIEYEVPKYDGDLGDPNLFVHLDEPEVQRKVDYLHAFFQSQKEKVWFSKDNFRSILRIRGVECNSPTNYAEAFYCRKIFF